ncbi:LuxR family transcriptional regulator [Fodinicola feengrottensis]|uniref:LuxR family transcriptional regulator n=1 Tax=Fodinicola feengrottensis TaxID=435914 RepID=A0ABP4UH25_9ACTN
MIPDQTRYLATLGLPDAEVEIYGHLLLIGTAAVQQIAQLTGYTAEAVQKAFTSLNEGGLVGLVGNDPAVVVPVRPGPALDLLIRSREAELARARIAAVNAYDEFHREVVRDSADQLVEVIEAPAVRNRIHQLEKSARAEIRALDSPPYYAVSNANDVELENLGRGVRYRAVYAKAALVESAYLAENVSPCIKAGEESRTLPELPAKLLIVDDECAVVALSQPEADVGRLALLIRPSSLLSALIGLFEICWRSALPLDLRGEPNGPYLQPSERRLLGLLAAGMGDEQAARSLGVSRRTLFRYLEGLMSRTGAANRFQLALYAVRNRWI